MLLYKRLLNMYSIYTVSKIIYRHCLSSYFPHTKWESLRGNFAIIITFNFQLWGQIVWIFVVVWMIETSGVWYLLYLVPLTWIVHVPRISWRSIDASHGIFTIPFEKLHSMGWCTSNIVFRAVNETSRNFIMPGK